MALKPLFGTLNASVSKTLLANAPKYQRIVEPFGDGGTWALELKKRRPKQHTINIVDPDLFAALSFTQNPSASDRARLKSFDWVGSQETFDKVMAISATEGPEHFYKFFYLKKFGMSMAPDQPPTFDLLSEGKDISGLLFALPLMKVGLKGARIVNDDPMSIINSAGGKDTFLILLPQTPEDVASVRSRLNSLSASVFFATKVPGVEQALEWSKSFPEQTSVITAPSIMMAKMAVVTNYETSLTPLDPDKAGKMKMNKTDSASGWHRVYRDPRAQLARSQALASLETLAAPLAAGTRRENRHYDMLLHEAAGRIVRKETAAMSKAAKRCASDAEMWRQAVEEFYGEEHVELVARTLQTDRRLAAVYVRQQRDRLLQQGAAALESWEAGAEETLISLTLVDEAV